MKSRQSNAIIAATILTQLVIFPAYSIAADAPATEDITPYLAKADVAKGKTTAKACLVCHSFEKGAPNKLGPTLWNIVNHERASVTGYAYSPSMSAMKGQKWTQQDLSNYLTSPMTYAKGTKMAFAGIKNPQERANVIAWLATLTDAK